MFFFVADLIVKILFSVTYNFITLLKITKLFENLIKLT